MTNETQLRLWRHDDAGVRHHLPLLSARGIKQTLQLLSAPLHKRTVEGTLVALGTAPAKYASKITCSDTAPMALDAAWYGCPLLVDCVVNLTAPVPDGDGSSEIFLGRTPVPGSVFLQDGATLTPLAIDGQKVTVARVRTGAFVTYRPRLNMMLKSFALESAEWEAKQGWTIDLEEV